MGASKQTLDFSKVKERGEYAPRRVKAGDYLAKVVDVKDSKSGKDQGFQYEFKIKLVQFSQNSYPYYCKLQENQLWKIRNLFLAAGQNVPKKRVTIDPNKVVGKMIGVTMEDDEYEGREKSTIAAIFPASELPEGDTSDGDDDEGDEDEDGYDAGEIDESYEEGADDEEEEEAEDEADEESGDQFDAMDRNELKAYLKAQDSTFQARKSQTDDDLRELARTTDSEEDEEEEEPEPTPPPRKAAAKKAPAKRAAAKKQTEDEELEELDIDDL